MELFNGLAATGIPVVTLLFAGRPLAIPDLVKKKASLLFVWHGGTRAAQGICDVLWGTVSPGGKLPVTFPISVGQIPIYYAHKNTGPPIESTGTIQFNTAHRSSYIDESNDPLFPFGFGLSYTTFLLFRFPVFHTKNRTKWHLEGSATITNSGDFRVKKSSSFTS
jgi:beta-glucosidase